VDPGHGPTGDAIDPTSISPHSTDLAPSPWICRHAALVPPAAQVLDLACGRGRHTRWFAARGHSVVAADRDDEALAGLRGQPGIEVLRADLEVAPWPLLGRRFGAIVVVNYLHRPTFDPLLAALADDAVLLYETFAVGNERFGRPSNPAFLLAEDELLARCTGRLRVVAFEQGRVENAGRCAVIQRIAAVGRACPWPPPLGMADSPGVSAAVSGRIG
jgi:SAM-dependent methyltransferase